METPTICTKCRNIRKPRTLIGRWIEKLNGVYHCKIPHHFRYPDYVTGATKTTYSCGAKNMNGDCADYREADGE